MREDVEFSSGGVRCSAWFYPAATGGTAPTVVMGHGLAGVRAMRLGDYAERFAAAGYNVLVFDYRHFGDSAGEPRQLVSIRRQHQDWAEAVAYARVRPETAGIVLWGYSLSGGHVMALAGRLQPDAVIAQMPHVSGVASVLRVPPRVLAPVIGHGLRDLLTAPWSRTPHYLPAIGAAGEVALMTAPEAMRYRELAPEGVEFDNRVAARFALAIGLYSPGRRLRRSGVPALVQVGLRDGITPPDPAIRVAERAPAASLSAYDADHFDPCLGETFDRIVAEQIAFLATTYGD
ncbi:alpha/beta hydrolase [Nocardioides daejeonensis]|uniref:alpha/beta hydrolase n=1 Tax=Nocardioides daejeonensis TaxID=1046556 RepID=UPI000D74FFA5|nr:alpha/beta fold hydrolase [Nocardioides daejeonensis]